MVVDIGKQIRYKKKFGPYFLGYLQIEFGSDVLPFGYKELNGEAPDS